MQTIEELQAKVKLYESNGTANLFYALNRKMNEMAGIMNKNNLTNLDITDPKDKTFERLKTIWGDAASIALAVKELGTIAGVTGDEQKDIDRKPFVNLIADDRK
jgi:hypothetical protein